MVRLNGLPSALATVLLLSTIPVSAATVEAPNVKVNYDGIDAKQAESIAKTLSAARSVYVTRFGFDMPQTISCTVECGPGKAARLYTDGNDRVFLSLPSKDKLAKPQLSGTFNLYGMCHELGHMAMYRLLKDRVWMTEAAAEGWAHFAGSVVVDEVFKARGQGLWWDAYDYRQDGTARLAAQRKGAKPSPIVRGAAAWQDLETVIGPQGFAALFKAWQAAKIDPAKPDALADEMTRLHPAKKDAIATWWKTAGAILTEARPASAFAKVELPPDKLANKPVTLAGDDGTPDGKKSTAGSGHARAFAAPSDGEWYLRSVSIFGARYGAAAAPTSTFELALCDAQMNPIATWTKPYAAFKRGEAAWVKVEVPPTRVPKDFVICVSFNPTATNGVFVAFDSSSNGKSSSALPGKPGQQMTNGEWMIRAELDQAKSADALRAE
jgi:hypothetical protein